MEEGLATDEQIEGLVVQVCYRAADLGYLLQLRDERLHREPMVEESVRRFGAPVWPGVVSPARSETDQHHGVSASWLRSRHAHSGVR